MKKVSLELQTKIVSAYLDGISYKYIQDIFKVSQWNIQDALSKAGIKTNRIEKPPRLPKFYTKKELKKMYPDRKGTLMERYHDGDYLPPLKPGKSTKEIYGSEILGQHDFKCGKELFGKNPVLEDDLDIMERYDLAGTEESESKYLEIDISENDEVRYIEK